MTVETIGWLAFLLVAGVLATDIWRVAGVFAALRALGLKILKSLEVTWPSRFQSARR